jgi:phage terminase small subunit
MTNKKKSNQSKPTQAKKALREEIFAREYVVDLNGTRAAIAAGYSAKGADVAAARLLGNARVKQSIAEIIEQRTKKLEISADEVLTELHRLAMSNFLDYATIQDGVAYVDLSKLTRAQAAAIQEVTVDEWLEGDEKKKHTVRRTKFKLADKRGSLELLGKYLKLFIDRSELTGPNGGPVPIQIISHIPRPKNLDKD